MSHPQRGRDASPGGDRVLPTLPEIAAKILMRGGYLFEFLGGVMRFVKIMALASAGVVLGVSPTAAIAQAKAGKQPSVFVQCDGRVGHVSAGEKLGRLLLVTATAGLSEAAMSADKADGRVSGVAGAAACDAALQSEGDGYRRAQLALAKALHLGEAGQWDAAATAARAAPSLIAAQAGDWSLTRTTETAAANIEAWALARAGKLAEAEMVQARAVLRAGADALALQRTASYLRLTRTMTEPKRQAYFHLLKYAPQFQTVVLYGFADAGDYRSARTAIRAIYALDKAMYKKAPPRSEFEAMEAAYAAMDGNAADARRLLDAARISFASDRSEGVFSSPASASSVDENLAFAEAATAMAEGKIADARRLIGQRSLWGGISPGMVTDLVTRLRADAPAGDRPGILASDPAVNWSDFANARIKLMGEEAETKRLWKSLTELMVDKHYAPLAGQLASGTGPKPKWLLKPFKDIPMNFELVSVTGRFYGPAINEPMMLHAAYIARARGKQGIALFPGRKSLEMVGVKFVNPGDEGIAAESIIDANALIAALEPHLKAPVPVK